MLYKIDIYMSSRYIYTETFPRIFRNNFMLRLITTICIRYAPIRLCLSVLLCEATLMQITLQNPDILPYYWRAYT